MSLFGDRRGWESRGALERESEIEIAKMACSASAKGYSRVLPAPPPLLPPSSSFLLVVVLGFSLSLLMPEDEHHEL